MAVDLSELVESLRNEVSAPGEDLIPGADDDTLIGVLKDGFWDAWLEGYFRDYTVDSTNDTIVPIESSTGDLERGLQQLIVLYSGYRIIRNKLTNMRTAVRTSVGRGAAETEIQRSANLLIEVLKSWTARLERLRDDLQAVGASQPVVAQFVNALVVRDSNLYAGYDSWVR